MTTKQNLSKQVYVPGIKTYFFFTEQEQQFSNIVLDGSKKIKENRRKIKTNKKEKSNGYTKSNKLLRNENSSLTTRIEKARRILWKLIARNKKKKNIRELTGKIEPKHMAGMFESALVRTLQMNEVSEDLIIVEVYHNDIMYQLLENGFNYKGESYVYLSSSSGQIKNQKIVMIKNSLWDQHKYTLMGGIDVEHINNKGGINPNKLLSYLSLTNSATVPFKFDLNKVVVVDDMEVTVNGLVDYVDDEAWTVTRETRDVPIKVTDGVGFCLKSVSDKAFMIRFPWGKGLICPVPFDEYQGKSTKVTDIWGDEKDIILDDIHMILHRSQFKLADYYDSWQDFIDNFTENNCEMAIGNVEDEQFADATFTYQMLQSLTDVSETELQSLINKSAEKIKKVGRDKDVMLDLLGVTEANEKKNYLQQAIEIYPNLMSDNYVKKVVIDTKKSYVNDARSGKIEIPNAKYTYVVPDVYAWMQWLFDGKKQPKGLLEHDQVSCKLYKDEKRLVLERSPHLYREHGLSTNKVNDDTKYWFISNSVYVSVGSLLPRMLQYDSDGDKLLLSDCETLTKVCERNMKGIVPLVYNQRSGDKQIINHDTIYNSLIAGFGGRIGDISNAISRAWHTENVDLDDIKVLCAINNNEIDWSKTLYRAELTEEMKGKLSKFYYGKLPSVFKYAKYKRTNQVQPLGEFTVDKMIKMIPNTKIHFASLFGHCNWEMLVNNPDINMSVYKDIITKFEEVTKEKRKIMKGYDGENNKKKVHYYYKYARDQLLAVKSNKKIVVDVLVKYLFKNDIENKEILWNSFGKVVLENLQKNLKNCRECEDCSARIQAKNGRKLCVKCANKREKKRLKNIARTENTKKAL